METLANAHFDKECNTNKNEKREHRESEIGNTLHIQQINKNQIAKHLYRLIQFYAKTKCTNIIPNRGQMVSAIVESCSRVCVNIAVGKHEI